MAREYCNQAVSLAIAPSNPMVPAVALQQRIDGVEKTDHHVLLSLVYTAFLPTESSHNSNFNWPIVQTLYNMIP